MEELLQVIGIRENTIASHLQHSILLYSETISQLLLVIHDNAKTSARLFEEQVKHYGVNVMYIATAHFNVLAQEIPHVFTGIHSENRALYHSISCYLRAKT